MSELSKFIASRNFTAVLKLDTQSRRGKTVTIIDGLPKNKLFLEAMLKALKARCGSGGSLDLSAKDGRLELQGDQREKIKIYLASEEIKFR